ncbi:MAG: ABC transporter substrate-binding protein [Eubacteriales bacterium]
MKRILAFLLAMMMIAGMMVSCGNSEEEEDKGAEISIYLGSEIRNWDPAQMYTQASAVKFFSLVYEGLTRINAEGKMELALAKSYKIIENEEDNEYAMEIELNESAWSDGRQISADDVIYAWKRILEPDYQSTACCMLYDIKNARAVRNGDATIDDLGLEALDTTVLKITFEGKIDYDLFLEYCASPALVPLREDVVGRYSDISSSDYWAKKSATTLSSGPFCVKNMDPDSAGKTLTLQRNDYYRALDGNKEGKIDKYVTPYRLNINFGYDSEGRMTAFNYDYTTGAIEITGGTLNTIDDQLMYLSDVPTTTDGVYVQDTFSVYSLYINCTKGVLSDAKVRQALSVALDRNTIAGMLNATEAATGLVPKPVFSTTLGSQSFRDLAGDVLSASGDTSKAKSLLSEAGVKSGSITFTYYRAREGADQVAEYIKSTWESLGFSVSLDAKGINQYTNKFFKDADTGEYDFDVIALDYQALSTNAFSILAPFAVPFSGSAKDIANNDFSDVPSISGYASDAYDALIEEAYAAETRDAMAAKLVEAEKLLMTDAPIIPLVFNIDTYIYNDSVLSKIGSNYFCGRVFTKTKMKNYADYTPVETMSPEDAATADLTEAAS